MSGIRDWLPSVFGGGSGASPPQSSNIPKLPENENDKKKEDGDARFDYRGLERAAAAAKELEKSPFGKDAVALKLEEEKTTQYKKFAEAEEFKAKQQALAVERARAEGEERRRSIEYEHQAAQQRQQYQDQLARKRDQDQLQAQQALKAQEFLVLSSLFFV